jgi:hypothetical protein
MQCWVHKGLSTRNSTGTAMQAIKDIIKALMTRNEYDGPIQECETYLEKGKELINDKYRVSQKFLYSKFRNLF